MNCESGGPVAAAWRYSDSKDVFAFKGWLIDCHIRPREKKVVPELLCELIGLQADCDYRQYILL